MELKDRSDLIKEAMNKTHEQIEEFPVGSKERIRLEELFCKLVELAIKSDEVNYTEYAQEQKIDADREKTAAEIRLKIEQYKAEMKRRWIPSADAVLLTVIFSLMTLVLYVIEGKGVIAPKAARMLEKLLKFVRIA